MQPNKWDTASNRQAEAGLTRTGAQEDAPVDDDAPDWLQIARAAYEEGTDYYRTNLQAQIERNYASFNNRHQSGSKYFSTAYKHRSKVFRPKTRSAIRAQEAAAATAFFSTADLVSVEPNDDSDETQEASAEINKALLNYRLDNKPIRWFPTLVGAFQDTKVTGLCISKQYWRYKERPVLDYEPEVDEAGIPVLDDDGYPVMAQVMRTEVEEDAPAIDLIPFENVRFSPAANWLDVVATSPYFIHITPMFVTDALDYAEQIDDKTGQPAWHKVDKADLARATSNDYEATRQAREDQRTDSKDAGTAVQDFDVVWIHENIVHLDGEDWVYTTLGTQKLLTDPKPLEEVYQHGRPFVVGFSNIEAHKTFPASMTQLTQDLQREVNEIANQRIDNVRLAMNPRYFYQAGKGLDLKELMTSVPGGPVKMTHSPKDALLIDRPPEVTGSSYREQTLLDVSFDEMAGNFSQGSVQTNRQLNETVGGLNLLSSSASQITDYDIRIFAETWVEPVLRQLVSLEQRYETDVTLLALAGRKAKLYQRYGITAIDDHLLNQELTVRVNVGIGSTNPQQRLERFMTGAQAVGAILGEQIQRRVNPEEVVSEVFGILGYKDGRRFFNWEEDNPEFAMLMDQLQELQGQLESEQQKEQARLVGDKMKADASMQETRFKSQADLLREVLQQQGEGMRQKRDIQAEAIIEQARLAHQEQQAQRDFRREAMQPRQPYRAA